jgi:4'-phosphopantetheinyl transferase
VLQFVLSPVEALLAAQTEPLSTAEQARATGLASELRRRQYQASRQLLRRLLRAVGEKRDGDALPLSTEGRPRVLDRPALYLSISHSGAWVACALADRPVGIDIERERPGRDLAGLGALIGAAGEPQAFYTAWTLKEAVLKRAGQGLDYEQLALWRPEPALPRAAGVASWCIDAADGEPALFVALACEGVAEAGIEWSGALEPRATGHWRLPSA